MVGLGHVIADGDIVLDERFAEPVYGVPSAATLEAIRLCARLAGMATDPVYEGKSMQAMIAMVRSGTFPPGSKILYVHLGGVPALSAYSYAFQEG
jgi:1-aminocyclopropane-1-carboxylate deaminase